MLNHPSGSPKAPSHERFNPDTGGNVENERDFIKHVYAILRQLKLIMKLMTTVCCVFLSETREMYSNIDRDSQALALFEPSSFFLMILWISSEVYTERISMILWKTYTSRIKSKSSPELGSPAPSATRSWNETQFCRWLIWLM